MHLTFSVLVRIIIKTLNNTVMKRFLFLKRNSYMLRTIITLAILLSAVELQAQKSNPRGIYHMVSITGKYGTEPIQDLYRHHDVDAERYRR